MSKLIPHNHSVGSGLLSAAASALLPGLGQWRNKQGDKALGLVTVFAGSALVAGLSIPVISSIALGATAVTWGYSVFDGYINGKR